MIILNLRRVCVYPCVFASVCVKRSVIARSFDSRASCSQSFSVFFFLFSISAVGRERLPPIPDERAGGGGGRRLSVTQDHRCRTGELIRDTHTHTHTISYLHTLSCLRMYIITLTHSCSSTHDLNFNCQGRSAVNWACKRFFFSAFVCLQYVCVCVCVCVCVSGGVGCAEAVIQSELKSSYTSATL